MAGQRTRGVEVEGEVEVDLVVVGGGVVGLGHAIEAQERGWRVAVVERDDWAVGASVRNFGHACVTAQAGVGRARAERARARWLDLAGRAGFWAREAGTVVVARADDELAVLRELAASEAGDGVEILTSDEVRDRVPTAAPDIVGGAVFARDLRVDPRAAVRAIGRWLADQPGVQFRTGESVQRVEPGLVVTSRGSLRTQRTVVCVGHDVDRFFPDLAAAHRVRRCALQMLRVAAPTGMCIGPAVLTGLSLLRYAAFAACPSLPTVRARLEREQPAAIAADVNLMLTQLPDGDILLGDTHTRDTTLEPFASEAWFDLLLAEGSRLLGAPRLAVRERWIGVYASAPEEFLVAEPLPGVTVACVTTGIGMTTGFGLAADVVGSW